MAAFTQYEGWEEDVRLVASRDVLPGGPHETPVATIAAQQRLLRACDPLKCGKILTHGSERRKVTYFPDLASSHYREMKCGLPVGHHPIVVTHDVDVLAPTDNRWHFIDWKVSCCDKPVEDPIHSPGHVPDVSEDAWR